MELHPYAAFIKIVKVIYARALIGLIEKAVNPPAPVAKPAPEEKVEFLRDTITGREFMKASENSRYAFINRVRLQPATISQSCDQIDVRFVDSDVSDYFRDKGKLGESARAVVLQIDSKLFRETMQAIQNFKNEKELQKWRWKNQ